MYTVSVKMGFRPLTDYTAVRPQSTINCSQQIDQSANITSCQHSGRNKPTQERLSELAMSRLDSQVSQATCPAGHNIHTLKETANAQRCNVPYCSSAHRATETLMANTANTLSNGTRSQKPDRQTTQQKQANSPKLPITQTTVRYDKRATSAFTTHTKLPSISLSPYPYSLSLFLYNSHLCCPVK